MTRLQKFGQNFLRDLSTSRYFQIYFVSWVVIVVASIGSLAVFSNQITNLGDHPYQLAWTTNDASLNFPRYHFRASENNTQDLTITSVSCNHLNSQLNTSSCHMNLYNSSCVAVLAGGIVAHRSGGEFSQRVDCYVNATINVANDAGQSVLNNLLAWELDDPQNLNFGDNSYSSVWIQPSTWAWVLLSPVNFDDKADYTRSIIYHGYNIDYGTYANTNATTQTLTYHVTTIINSFTVWHYRTSGRLVSGFDVAGLLGGFSFFVYIIHTIFMFLVGFSMDNDSVLLGGEPERDGETRRLLDNSQPPVAPPVSTATAFQDSL